MAKTPLIAPGRRRKTDAEALAAAIRPSAARGGLRVLHLVVASYGDLLVFQGLGVRSYRLVDHCPHCFVEWQLPLFLGEVGGQRAVGEYRASLARDQPVEVQLICSTDQQSQLQHEELGRWKVK